MVRFSRRSFLGAAPAAALWSVGCGSAEEPSSPAASSSAEARSVSLVLPAQPTKDGAGVKLARSIGGGSLRNLDPFLLLDEIRTDEANDYLAGFPNHPHRGFETVTYMIDGAMEHRDSVGNQGRLGPGSIQWMTAGSGLVHSEMPQQERGLLWGFQLWVNLPKRLKMIPPRYQDIAKDRVPEVSGNGAEVRVAAGTAFGQTGPVEGIAVGPTLLEVRVPPNGAFTHELPPSQTAFAYVLEGMLEVGPERRAVPKSTLAVFDRGPTIIAKAGSQGGRMLLVSADPIGEPIARGGPFVMNADAEIQQAWADYRAGRLGG